MLERMSQGGIYDHLGGGYARYSTDEVWLVPHFEKMLYDNAQLLELLALAHADRPNPLYAQRATETVGWMMRDMTRAARRRMAAFAASEDADSEGEEGRFYVWTEAEVDALLGPEAAAFKQAYDVTPSGNWEGHTILRRVTAPGSPDRRPACQRRECCSGRAETRVRPGWDDKVLADWNGLAIAALARCAAVFGQTGMAGPCARGVRLHLDPDDRRPWRCRACMAARPGHGTGSDRGSGGDGACGPRPVRGDRRERLPRELPNGWRMRRRQRSPTGHGGFFTTAAGAADVPLARPRTAADNATPSGNGMMAEVLRRLFHLTGDARLAGPRRGGAQGVQLARRTSWPACRHCWRRRICWRKPPAW